VVLSLVQCGVYMHPSWSRFLCSSWFIDDRLPHTRRARVQRCMPVALYRWAGTLFTCLVSVGVMTVVMVATSQEIVFEIGCVIAGGVAVLLLSWGLGELHGKHRVAFSRNLFPAFRSVVWLWGCPVPRKSLVAFHSHLGVHVCGFLL